MFCCIKPKNITDDNCQIFEVETMLQDFVWSEFQKKYNKFQRWFLRRSSFRVDVPMNYFKFQTIDQELEEKAMLWEDPKGRIWHQQGIEERDKKKEDKKKPSQRKPGHSSVELNTTFNNDTNKEQTYSFRLEKSRKATVKVQVQKGISVGGKANFGLKIGAIPGGGGKADATIDVKYHVTKQSEDTIEDAAIFETTSDVKVGEHSKCIAKVIMDEVNVDYNFRVKSLMTVLSGGSPATVKRKKDGFLYFTYLVNDISRVFKTYKLDFVDLHPKITEEDLLASSSSGDDEGTNNANDNATASSNNDENQSNSEVNKGDNHANSAMNDCSKVTSLVARKNAQISTDKNEIIQGGDGGEASESTALIGNDKDNDKDRNYSQSIQNAPMRTDNSSRDSKSSHNSSSHKEHHTGGDTANTTSNTTTNVTTDTTTNTTTNITTTNTTSTNNVTTTDDNSIQMTLLRNNTTTVGAGQRTERVGHRVLFTICGTIQGVRLSDQRITLESIRLRPGENNQTTQTSPAFHITTQTSRDAS